MQSSEVHHELQCTLKTITGQLMRNRRIQLAQLYPLILDEQQQVPLGVTCFTHARIGGRAGNEGGGGGEGGGGTEITSTDKLALHQCYT